jgi:tetratricopeptide (TPR) repeat protein
MFKYIEKHSSPLTVVLVAVIVFCVSASFPYMKNRFEDVMFYLDPSAERALAYGDLHFNAMRSYEYDVARAEAFFRKAYELDPTLTYIHHQLARIEFLRGNFPAAVELIDKQIEFHGTSTINSFYMRGLILGYKGDYLEAAKSYQAYLEADPRNWAAITDYSWVLLKANKPQESLDALLVGIDIFPDNPWILNGIAISLYELGRYEEALPYAEKAAREVKNVTTRMWLTAYPGNDPRVAEQGINTLTESINTNLEKIRERIRSREKSKDA